MRRVAMFVLVACGVLLYAASSSRSDTQPDDPVGMPTSEPATEPLGSEPRWEPLTAHEVGPPGKVWRYEDMSPAEKAIVDRAVSQADDRQRSNDVFAAAAAEQFEHSVAALAEHQLGLADLADLGVVGGVTGDQPGGVGDGNPDDPGMGAGTGGGGGDGTGGGGGRGTGGGRRHLTGGGS